MNPFKFLPVGQLGILRDKISDKKSFKIFLRQREHYSNS